MSLESHVRQAAASVHTLATADVIPNTFGLIGSIHRDLQQIAAALPSADTAARADQDTIRQLRQLIDRIEGNRLLFAIPETWLINNVMSAAATVRQRLDRLFPPQ
jgi:hypothetical protein